MSSASYWSDGDDDDEGVRLPPTAVLPEFAWSLIFRGLTRTCDRLSFAAATRVFRRIAIREWRGRLWLNMRRILASEPSTVVPHPCLPPFVNARWHIRYAELYSDSKRENWKNIRVFDNTPLRGLSFKISKLDAELVEIIPATVQHLSLSVHSVASGEEADICRRLRKLRRLELTISRDDIPSLHSRLICSQEEDNTPKSAFELFSFGDDPSVAAPSVTVINRLCKDGVSRLCLPTIELSSLPSLANILDSDSDAYDDYAPHETGALGGFDESDLVFSSDDGGDGADYDDDGGALLFADGAPNLTHLIATEGLPHPALVNLKALERLRFLDVGGCHPDKLGPYITASCATLTHFKSRIKTQQDEDALALCTHMRVLNVDNSSAFIGSCCASMPQLTHLSIERCKCISDTAIADAATRQLRVLKARYTPIGDAAVMPHRHSLLELDARSSCVTGEFIVRDDCNLRCFRFDGSPVRVEHFISGLFRSLPVGARLGWLCVESECCSGRFRLLMPESDEYSWKVMASVIAITVRGLKIDFDLCEAWTYTRHTVNGMYRNSKRALPEVTSDLEQCRLMGVLRSNVRLRTLIDPYWRLERMISERKQYGLSVVTPEDALFMRMHDERCAKEDSVCDYCSDLVPIRDVDDEELDNDDDRRYIVWSK